MDRRTFLVTLGGGLLAAPLPTEAQQAGQIPRIGYLGNNRRENIGHLVAALQAGLRNLGYVEGRNILIEYRFDDLRPERLPDLAAELVRHKVNVIVVTTNSTIVAAKQATTTIPIVMILALDPVGMGFIASYAKPGGNVTGLTFDVSPETAGKTIGLLKELVPRLSNLTVFWDPSFPGRRPYVNGARDTGQRLGITAQAMEMRTSAEIDRALVTVGNQRGGAVFAIAAPAIYARRRDIADWSVKNGRPLVGDVREFVEAGALMSYGANMVDLSQRAATYVDKILRGAKPADLPVEQPTKFELVINLKTAKALGLTIPQSFLLRADQVVE